MKARRQEGFTLTELLVILLLIGVISMMLIPSLDTFMPRISFDSASRQLVSDISLQRLRAVERRETTSITYDETARAYTLNPYGVTCTFPDEVVAVTFPEVGFNSRGLIPSGNDVTITLTGEGDRQRSFHVSPAGRIRIFEPGP